MKGKESLLVGLRALDLTDDKGLLCGRILADLGVDVIQIEKPGGSSCRRIGPYYNDEPDLEKSLYWFAYCANKRGITLNIEVSDGQEILKSLLKGADFVLESFSPGFMDTIGLSYNSLSKINSRVILTSITPFGQEGPYSKYKASDLVSLGMGGQLYLCGDPDRPPVQIGFPQAYLHASIQAAMGTMVAHYFRQMTGIGQHVDVSIHESVQQTLMAAPLFWEMAGVNLRREGAFRAGLTVGAVQQQIWPCKDGHVIFAIYGGKLGAPTNRGLVQWMDEEGMAPDFLKQIDWDKFDMARTNQEELNSFQKPIAKFFEKYTKEELLQGALKRRIMLYPAATTKDIAESVQLRSRDFWNEIEHPEMNTTIAYPGTFAKFSKGVAGIRKRAPLIGENNREIYEGELGFSREDLLLLKQSGVI